MPDPEGRSTDTPSNSPSNAALTRQQSTAAVAVAPPPMPSDVAAIEERTAWYQTRARAANTRRAYRADWDHFAAWCATYQATPVPAHPGLVARYLAAFAGALKTSTLQRRLAAINDVHRALGLEFDRRAPELRDTWRGIRRTHGVAAVGKAPAVTQEIRAMIAALDLTQPRGLRDRALLLVGFAGCFRRAELVALDVDHVVEHRDGLLLQLPRSKTDQEGHGAEKGIPYGQFPDTCPVRALSDWRAVAGIRDGALFRSVTRHCKVGTRLSDRGVALIVKRSVLEAKAVAIANGDRVLADQLDPARYAGHSLRAGFITSAAAANVSTHDIMRQSLHKREETLRKYIRHGTVFEQNAATRVGL